MKKNVVVGTNIIEYTLKISKKSKSMRISVYHDGSVFVSVPRFMNIGFLIDNFIKKKAEWIISKQKHFKNIGPKVFIKKTKAEKRLEYLKNKEVAMALVERKVNEYNKFYNYKIGKITIKNQKTRWGSCSKRGNLNFNYKLALIPDNLANYIVVHEICHLGELNHSKKFWDLVSKTMPEHKALRAELNKIGINYQ